MAANTTRGKIFYAEAVKGYTLKVMIDSLSAAMPRTTFCLTKDGFFHRNMDEAHHVLFDIAFPRENFRPYVCRKEVAFSVNLIHLQKLVRNVKKKDSIVMFLTKKDPDQLILAIRPNASGLGHNSRIETNGITITRIKEEVQHLALPELYVNEDEEEIQTYDYPMVIDAADFQKMKKMANVGKIVKVEMQASNYISFYCDNGKLYNSKLEFGEILDDPYASSSDEESDVSTEEEENEEEYTSSDEEDIKGWYEADFHMNIFSLLMKFPGLCSQMKFYAPQVKRYPLKIAMQAGNLGTIIVYIKDTAQIAYEQTQKDSINAEDKKK